MLSALDSLLKLPGVTVEGHTQVEGYICLHLKIQRQEITCAHCTKLTPELHQVRPILVRDLPTFGQAVYLRVPRRQFYCRHCQKYVTEKLDFISWRRPCLRLAYELKEEFRQIYETSKTVQSGMKRMQKWLVQAQVFYGKTAQTIREHLSGICNYFISGTTSGVMEGINNKIKLIMRLGYGLTNFNNLRSRLLGCCC